MSPLPRLIDKYRPDFEKGGKLELLYSVFTTVEHVFYSPEKTAQSSPFIRDAIDLKRYMSMVILALIPSLISAVYFFGPRILALTLVSYAVGGTVEVLFAIIRKEEINEGFLVTGLIYPLILPPSLPLWIAAVGIFAGVLFGKEVFGGTGRNIFNPALVGRLFITISFPAAMSAKWLQPATDAITSATPLSLFKTGFLLTPEISLLMGKVAGSAGETFRIGIIAGGLFLVFTKVANWRIPLTYIGTVFLFSWLGYTFYPHKIAPPVFSVLAGGLLFGAFFMATDPVTSPVTKSGKYIFGSLCGILTVLIRSFSGYVEGVMFSIVIMNAFVPLIDHTIINLKFRPGRYEK